MSGSAEKTLGVLLASLDAVLVGLAITTTADAVTKGEFTSIYLVVGYLLMLANFFHAKLNLVLVSEFGEFSEDAPQWLNSMNTLLHLVLIVSFVFMAYSLDSLFPFIAFNLVMRFCDLAMDVGVLGHVGRMNLHELTANDLRHVHYFWTAGTLVWFGFLLSSLPLIATDAWTPETFGAVFLVLEVVDLIVDYTWNRRFYFGKRTRSRVLHIRSAASNLAAQARELLNDFSIGEVPGSTVSRETWVLDTSAGVSAAVVGRELQATNFLQVYQLACRRGYPKASEVMWKTLRQASPEGEANAYGGYLLSGFAKAAHRQILADFRAFAAQEGLSFVEEGNDVIMIAALPSLLVVRGRPAK